MDKDALRRSYLQRRKDLSPAELEEHSERIAHRFMELPLGNIDFIHIFYPIVGKAEVDTLKIAERVRIANPRIKLVLSRVDPKAHTLSHVIWDEHTALAVNSWGITEPENGIAVLPGQLDIILIPLLAFDKRGNRVGYGKGFYDRFLSACRPDAQKIGLSFFDPTDGVIDVNPHDIPLDACITPERVWWF